METRKIDRTGRFVEKHAIEEIKRKVKEFEKDAVKIVGNLDAQARTENALRKQRVKVRLAVEHNLEQQRNYRKVKVRNLGCPSLPYMELLMGWEGLSGKGHRERDIDRQTDRQRDRQTDRNFYCELLLIPSPQLHRKFGATT